MKLRNGKGLVGPEEEPFIFRVRFVIHTKPPLVDIHSELYVLCMRCSCKMMPMPTIQIRNFPEELYEMLKSSATRSRRSLTQEAIHLLELQLKYPKKSIDTKRRLLQEANAMLSEDIRTDMKQIVHWIREDREK